MIFGLPFRQTILELFDLLAASPNIVYDKERISNDTMDRKDLQEVSVAGAGM